ncbi:hypothetical protein M431DRAFT_385252 [Trichoderma harzianum CBS 226.95]|uniref:Uncharacterized protein n=1 Tax=Trichoderma harzianum CBS 226.95 TaxID=983964 RepID=A0A2T4AHZ8_TRIHA|nr:hypothetical protein M431DRAFT_385252 [Trichoderma harzianum CBS 226.95]PTB56714.1 hypothetical protein M431DRAFT_385252 [Trichoderma harzianum CBS 226.95]
MHGVSDLFFSKKKRGGKTSSSEGTIEIFLNILAFLHIYLSLGIGSIRHQLNIYTWRCICISNTYLLCCLSTVGL